MTTLPAIFPTDNIWNVNISGMPVAASSAAFLTSLGGASCPFSMWTQIPYTTVPSTQATVAIHLGTFAAQSDPGPSPIPNTAPVENTSDHHVIVVQLGANKLYELYHGVLQGDNSWNADQQSIYDLTSSVLRTDGWTSADAAGLPIFPGLLRFAEVSAGIIPHCLRVVVGNGLTDNTHVWPARHHQSSVHNAAYPPMGQRFRLKASKDITSFSKTARVILQCMKSYGCMIADMSSATTQFQLMADLDPGWSGFSFAELNAITVNDFEAVDVSSLMLISTSGQTRGGPTFTVAGISYPVEEGTLQIATKIDERTRFTGSLVDTRNIAVMSKGQKVVASDPSLGIIPFCGFIRQSTPTPLVPQPYSYWQIDAPDYFYAAEKRTSNRVYATPTPAAKIAVDLVTDVLASEGVQAAYAARTESTVSDFQQGTLSSVSAAPSIGDGDLELATSASASDTYNSQSKWSSGTISNTLANTGGDLSLNGFTRNWDNGLHPNQTLFGNGNPHDSVSNGQYILNCNAGSETRSRLDFAGNWTNGTIEVDVTLNNDIVKPGFTFRTTVWNNNDDYAYAVELSTAKIDLRKGTNGAGGSTSSMASLTFANKLGTGTYRVRVVMNGSSFSAYLNGTFQCSATDSTYSSAAMIALRNRNPSGAGTNAQAFDNFGVMSALSGTWISPGTSLASVTSIASTITSWDTSLSQGGTIKVETSTDNGTTYQVAANGGAISGLASGSSGVGKTLKIRVTLSTTTTATMPDIKNLRWQVLGGYVASGTRTTVAPSIQDQDTFTRADQSGWNPASSGSTWRQDSGNGTLAIASNEGTVNGSHTFNYMLLGNQIGADIDLKVRVKLGATNDFAAILARYQDNNNFYRCNIGFGSIRIDKYDNGVQTQFLQIGEGLVGGTFYWLRFQLIGSTLSGKVWADGSSEPANFQTVVGDTDYSQGAFGLYGNPSTSTAIQFDTFTATHAGVFPALDLTPVGRCGSSFIGWNANVPTNTSLGVDVSLDGSTWVDVSGQNGGTIPLFNATPDPTIDLFSSDTSTNYLNTNGALGSTGLWTINTSQSRVEATGGVYAIYLNANIVWSDIDMLTHTDLCDSGGLVWRFTDPNNYYVLVFNDASSAITTLPRYRIRAFGSTLILSSGSIGAANSATLYKVSSGTRTQLATTSISFTRGTYHNFRVTMLGGVITAFMDGVQLFTYTDSSPLGAGLCGLYNDSGATGSRFYQLWIQPQGDDLTGLTVYTRLRLATSDSTVSPQVLDLTVAAFGQNIGVGAIIPSMDNSHVYASDVLNSLVQKSGDYYCDFIPTTNQTAQLVFKKRTTVPAPWILQPNDTLVQDVQPTYPDGNYSNRQVLKGVIGTGTFSDQFIGDGNRTSFPLRYKIAPGTVPTIRLNGNLQSVGMKGSSGFAWYYAEGETEIAQDSGGTVLTSSDTLLVNPYTGTFDTSVTRDNTAGQAAMQTLEQTGTGIVEQVTDVSQLNMDVPTAQALGDQLNIRQGILGRTITFSTLRTGLAAGQTQAAFFPTRAINNMQMLISAVDISIRTFRKSDGSVGNQYVYAVTASELSNQKSWQKQILAAANA